MRADAGIDPRRRRRSGLIVAQTAPVQRREPAVEAPDAEPDAEADEQVAGERADRAADHGHEQQQPDEQRGPEHRAPRDPPRAVVAPLRIRRPVRRLPSGVRYEADKGHTPQATRPSGHSQGVSYRLE